MNAVRSRAATRPKRTLHLVVLERDGESYWFRFETSRREEAIQRIGRMASDPELSLTWFEAAVLAQKIRSVAAMADAMSEPPRPAPITPRPAPPLLKNILQKILRALCVLRGA